MLDLNPLEVHHQIVSLLESQGPVILDIGSYDGTDARRFLQLRPEAQFYCFEPDLRALVRFKRNMQDVKNVRLFEYAISDRNGNIEFHPSNGDGEAEGWDLSAQYAGQRIILPSMIGFDSIIRSPLKREGWMTGAAKLT